MPPTPPICRYDVRKVEKHVSPLSTMLACLVLEWLSLVSVALSVDNSIRFSLLPFGLVNVKPTDRTDSRPVLANDSISSYSILLEPKIIAFCFLIDCYSAIRFH